MDLRPIPESNVLFVAAEADEPDLTQQGALVAERGVNRLDGDPGIAGDVSDRGVPYPLLTKRSCAAWMIRCRVSRACSCRQVESYCLLTASGI